MTGITHGFGRFLIALLATTTIVSSQQLHEQIFLFAALVSLVIARILLAQKSYDNLGAALIGIMIPTIPWVGAHVLLGVALSFFALRTRPPREVTKYSPEDSLLWIAPLMGFLIGSVAGELSAAFSLFDPVTQGLASNLRLDGVARVADLVRSVVDVQIVSWHLLARVLLAGCFVGFLSGNGGLTRTLVKWLQSSAFLSALFVLLQWVGGLSFRLPNQTALWDSLGRPSGLLTDPNSLGLVMALVLWIVFLVRPLSFSSLMPNALWTASIVLAGIFSGSRTFLLSAGILLLLIIWRRANRVHASPRVNGTVLVFTLVFSVIVVGITLVDANSGLVGQLAASESLPMGIRRGVAALSLLRLEETFMSRTVFIEFVREIGRGHWIFGIGADRFIDYVPLVGAERNLVRGWRDNSNNLYLGILTELGVLGGITFVLAIISRVIRDGSGVDLHLGTSRKVYYVGAVVMLGVLGLTGPHTDFVEVLLLVSALVAITTESRYLFLPTYRILAVIALFAGVIASGFHEQGVYGWNDTPYGAARWLSHNARVELECTNATPEGLHARFKVQPRYVPQTEPLRLSIATELGSTQEISLYSGSNHEIMIPCVRAGENFFAQVVTRPAWSPYRAWPKVSGDRRILGVEQIFEPDSSG